jgi:hypothetical protein
MTAHLVTGAMLVSFALAVPVHAQTSTPALPKTDTPQSESTGPQDPRSTGSTTRSNEPLSERLSESGGVIRPREDVAPDIAIRPADPGTTRVIPPSSTPGGGPTSEPK